MRLCAVLDVKKARRVPEVSPATWVIQEATLEVEPPELAPHLHAEGRTETHHPLRVGMIRVCIPMEMVQEELALFQEEAHGTFTLRGR